MHREVWPSGERERERWGETATETDAETETETFGEKEREYERKREMVSDRYEKDRQMMREGARERECYIVPLRHLAVTLADCHIQ